MKYIVTGDQHIRPDVPVCRKETEAEWMDFQYARLCEVVDLANTYEADIAFTGDTFDVPRVPPECVSILLTSLQPLLGTAHFISGNHEKQYHREANVDMSSIGIIKAIAHDNSGKIRYYEADEFLIDGRFEHSAPIDEDVTLVHTLSFPTEDDVPFEARATTADELCQKYNTPWIFVGDNHTPSHTVIGSQHVVSSGCLTAQTVREKDSKLGVWLVDTGTRVDVTVQTDTRPMYRVKGGSIEFLPIFHDPSLVSTDHLTKRKKDDTIDSIIEVFTKEGVELTLDFVENLKKYVEKMKVPLDVEHILDEIRDEE